MAESQLATPYIVSALRHRPATFGEVLGQEHVTTTLVHSLERNRIANAYLFSGPRGTGKTSTARILAKALNCSNRQGSEPCNRCESCRSITNGTNLDVLEIDAASNRGIEEIRDLRENVRFSPTYGQYRVVIIDEVHMLTNEANNALLKTLEEPPGHVKFILATTEMHKMPATILSRCQRFRFRRIPVSILMDKLRAVADGEPHVDLGPAAERDGILYHIARMSDGALRDALVSLDQLLSFCSGKVSLPEAEEILGVVEFEALENLIRFILAGDLNGILLVIDRLCIRGKEPAQFLKEIMTYLRHLLVSKVAPDKPELVELPDESRQALATQAQTTTVEAILQVMDIFAEAERRMRFASEGRMILEVAAIKAAKVGEAVQLSSILQFLSELSGSAPSSSVVRKSNPGHSGESRAPAPSPPQPAKTETPLPPKEEPISEPESSGNPMGKAEAAWKSLSEDLELSAPTINSALVHSRPLRLEGDLLTVGVPTKAGLKRLQDYQKTMQDKLASLTGGPIRLVFEISEKTELSSAGTPSRTSTYEPRTGELLSQAREHAVIRSLMDYVPGTVEEIRPEPQRTRGSSSKREKEAAE